MQIFKIFIEIMFHNILGDEDDKIHFWYQDGCPAGGRGARATAHNLDFALLLDYVFAIVHTWYAQWEINHMEPSFWARTCS